MRDEQAKRDRGYKHPKSLVRPDGSETLHGADWKRRKEELRLRSGGWCEWVNSDGIRCHSYGRDPHHKKARSKGRDDRLDNLAHLCGFHHDLVDWKKLKWTRGKS